MTDQELLNNIRKLADAVLAAGMIKTVQDAEGLAAMVKAAEARLLPAPAPNIVNS